MVRQGLLHAGLAMLQARGGFGNALGEGLQSGLLAMNQSADDIVNDRYRQAMMARTMQGAEQNTRADELASRVWVNGKPDMAVARELAAIDAPRAKALLEFGQPEQESWLPTEITDPTNPNNVLSVFHNGHGQLRYPDGTPVFGGDMSAAQGGPQVAGGLLGDAIPQTPRFGIMDAVEQVESGGNPYAVSPKGALGPMQTMPGTLMNPGFGVTPARDNSVAEQRRVGQDYLNALTEKYGITGGLAAYNWGPGNWDRALASNNNDVSAALSAAPQETRDYVPKVMDLVGAGTAAPAASRFSRPRFKPEGDASGMGAIPSGYRLTADGKSLEPVPGGPADRKNNPTPSDLSKAEMAMRKEVTDRVKDQREVLTMYQKVQAAAHQPSAANDLSLIFGYMKMLDPGSVVREQEFANA